MDLISLLPQFGGLVWTIVAFVIALSVIVAIHEYGHYIVGKWSGIKADVFSIGFGPVLASRLDKHGTKWQIAALPFGGYVKFRGDSNAASAKDSDAMSELSPEERRHTMHGAPLWARAATAAAGPVFNFIFSILVFMGFGLFIGGPKDPLTIDSIAPLPNYSADLQRGDIVRAIAGKTVPSIDDPAYGKFLGDLPLNDYLDFDITRDGQNMTILAPYPFPPLVANVAPKSASYDIGIQSGDVVTHVDGVEIFAFEQLRDRVMAAQGKPVKLDIWRDGESLEFVLVARRVDEPQADGGFETNWRIGIRGGIYFETQNQSLGFAESFMRGVSQTWSVVSSTFSALYHMIIGSISTCNLSGPLGIAEVSGAVASEGVEDFVWFVAIMSTAIGLMNLFPIPVLDGGHLMFHAYEAITGRPPSDKALRVLMTFGLFLMLMLTVFALTNDLFCP